MRLFFCLSECALLLAAFLLSLLRWLIAWDTRDLDGDEYAEVL